MQAVERLQAMQAVQAMRRLPGNAELIGCSHVPLLPVAWGDDLLLEELEALQPRLLPQ